MKLKRACLLTCTIQNKTYLIHPLALFQFLSRNVIVVSRAQHAWAILVTWLRRFVPLIETSSSIQFSVKGKVFTILNKSSFFCKDSYLYSLLGLSISWQRELSYLRSLQIKGSYRENLRLGGIISKSELEFSQRPSYDATRFYVSIVCSLAKNSSMLLPKGWHQAWFMSEQWATYAKGSVTYYPRSGVSTLAGSFGLPLATFISLNKTQKDNELGEGLSNYFIGLLSLHNSTFNYITSRGRIIIQFMVPYSQFNNRNIDSMW